MFQENAVNLPDDPFQGVRVQSVAVRIGKDCRDRERGARSASFTLKILVGLPVHEEARLDLGRRLDVFWRLEPSLLIGRDERLRDILGPDPETMIEDLGQFPAASSS